MRNPLKFYLPLTCLIFLAASCTDGTSTDETNTLPETTLDSAEINASAKDRVRFQRAKIVFFSLPSPMETSRILKKSGAIYNKESLNEPGNINNYQTSKSKAIALGIYVADLSYANAFGQQQDCFDYFSAVRSLSDDLSLSGVFTKEFIEKVDEHINSEDSVLKFLSESYWKANTELKENDRESLAALVAAGGWIEGLYIAVSLVGSSDENSMIAERIAEQKGSLKQLIKYLKSFKDPKNLKEVLNDLEELEVLFDEIQTTSTPAQDSVDENGVAVIGSKISHTYPEGVLQKIIAKTTDIRKKYA
ncbi:hypothetical protein KFE98_06965 [bacterium SCSIO 12741]|nr:hypothetical protein KFE98_06965 [bacterium SCSIO 12741]